MTDIENAAEWYADKYYNKSNDINIASKKSFKEGADYALDKVVEWLFYEASKYAVTSFHKDAFDVNVMITNMLKAIEGDDEEAKEEEHITDAMELLYKLGIEVTIDTEE